MCLFLAIDALAQDKMIIREDFEGNRLGWDEDYQKEYTVSVLDGYLELKCNKEDQRAYTVTELPINSEANFKVTSKYTAPKISDNCFFGIIFNFEDENNYSYFVVAEKRFIVFNRINGIDNISRRNSIVLTKGRDKDVVIEMERKGNKLVFNVDEMEAISITKRSVNSTFGYIVLGNNTIKVNEAIIEQMVEE